MIFELFQEFFIISYISFKNAFFNFLTLFSSLYNEEYTNEILNKIIVFYTFNISIDGTIFNEISFDDYVNLVKEQNLQEKLMENDEKNIPKGINALINHISNEFGTIIQKI